MKFTRFAVLTMISVAFIVVLAQPATTEITVEFPDARLAALDALCAEIAVQREFRLPFTRAQCLVAIATKQVARARVTRDTGTARRRPRYNDPTVIKAICGDGVVDAHLGEECDGGPSCTVDCRNE